MQHVDYVGDVELHVATDFAETDSGRWLSGYEQLRVVLEKAHTNIRKHANKYPRVSWKKKQATAFGFREEQLSGSWFNGSRAPTGFIIQSQYTHAYMPII